MITAFNQLDLNKQYTYADYLTWQFEERVELIKGWIWKMSPAPLRQHQDISGNFFGQLFNYLKNKPCKVYAAPFDVRLISKQQNTTNQSIVSVVQPDISIVCDLSKLDEKGCVGAPDLIIEILSPGNSKKELKDKYNLYEENGVREYWIVAPAYLSISVYDLVDDVFKLRDTYYEGDEIPVGIFQGFSIDSKQLFS
jgi:Uma2 family endonuclease